VTRRRILVTGADGRLARAIRDDFARDSDLVALTHADLDITDSRAVGARVAAERPDVIVNCASDNDVDGAQDRPVRALDVNAFAVRTLARAADGAGSALVHFSSDFVFDGAGSRPYTEEDAPNPLSVYASSKLLGEWFALEARRGFVLRVESLFGGFERGSGRRGSLDGILDGIEAGVEVPVFVDRTVSPSYVPDVAAATRQLLRSGAAAGLYHCVNAGACSWFDVAMEMARVLGRKPRLKPITLDGMALKAHRPKFSALDTARLRAAGIHMPTWQDAVARYLRGG
jgi:dTDP-4-dehydrorhamnose reductase